MQVLSWKVKVFVYTCKHEWDFIKKKEAPNSLISKDSCFQQYSGDEEGYSARSKRAQRFKGESRENEPSGCINRAVEEEKMFLFLDVLSVVCCSCCHRL